MQKQRMNIAGGILTPDLTDTDQRAFFGVGFGKAGVPLDLVPIFNLEYVVSDFSLLVVDEFVRFNGYEDHLVDSMLKNFLETLDTLSRVYPDGPQIVLCSDYMNTPAYKQKFIEIKEQVASDRTLSGLTSGTVPERIHDRQASEDYPLHEFACVKHMQDMGYTMKLGPSKEKQYDEIMKNMGIMVSFGYILDAYCLGTRTPDKVVHYVPGSRGTNNGQRIFFGDSKHQIKSKIYQGNDVALRYFCRIASVSGYLLGKDYLGEDEIEMMHGKKLKKNALQLVMKNIIEPYMEAK